MIDHTTTQRVFDTVAAHLLKQGIRSADPTTHQCLYRGPNGVKCAVGVLIPDVEYSAELEGNSVAAVANNVPSVQALTEKVPEMLLREMQLIHDKHFPSAWPRLLTELATAYKLLPFPRGRF